MQDSSPVQISTNTGDEAVRGGLYQGRDSPDQYIIASAFKVRYHCPNYLLSPGIMIRPEGLHSIMTDSQLHYLLPGVLALRQGKMAIRRAQAAYEAKALMHQGVRKSENQR